MRRMKKKQLYTWGAEALVTAELPQALKDAMSTTGWNAFGVYELVKDAIRKDRARSRKETAYNVKVRGRPLLGDPSSPPGWAGLTGEEK